MQKGICMEKTKVLFVCMGNICRSPMAHGVLETRIVKERLEEQLAVDSAGTHGYHVGHPPDPRAQATARTRGYEIAGQQARQLSDADFHAFDYILTMDDDNFHIARALQPPQARARLHRFMEFAPLRQEREVPDPYYGGPDGFQHVLTLVEEGVEGLLEHLRVTGVLPLRLPY